MMMVPPHAPQYELHRVFLSPEEVNGYYNRYANQGLWPLSHMLIERTQFSREAFHIYRAVNLKFARRVAQIAPEHGAVFSHDYHWRYLPVLSEKCGRIWPPPTSGIFRGLRLRYFGFAHNIRKSFAAYWARTFWDFKLLRTLTTFLPQWNAA